MIRFAFALLLGLLIYPAQADHCVLPQGNMMTRPAAQAGPTEVAVRVYVIDIIKINDAEQSFTSDVFFRADWKDPRLTHGGPEKCSLNRGDIWSPGLRMLNRRTLQSDLPSTIEVFPDGTVSQSLRGFGDFSFRADLRNFPFDQQELGFRLIANHGEEDVNFTIDQDLLGMADPLSVANWRIQMAGAQKDTQYIAPAHRELARLNITLRASRLTGYYTWQQLVPLCLVVMMTWVVFWIPLEFVAPRVGLAATSMLTLIAYRFAMSSVLPPIAYLTRLDVFMIGASVLVFAALAVAVGVTWIAHYRSEELGERINRDARWISPLVLVLLTGLAFVS